MLTAKDLQNLLQSFVEHLVQSRSSRSTIKNYTSDLKTILEKLPLDSEIRQESLNTVLASLKGQFSEATLRRFGYSLKAFTSWLKAAGYEIKTSVPSGQVANQQPRIQTTQMYQNVTKTDISSPLDQYSAYIKSQGAASSTNKLYTAAVASFFSWLRPEFKENQTLTQQNINKVSHNDIERYISYLRSKQTSGSTIQNQLYSLKSFFNLHKEDIVYETNPVTFTRPGLVNGGHFWQKFKIKKPRFWHAYRGHPMSDYVNWAASAGVVLIVGIMIFQWLFAPKPIDITNLKTEIQKGLVLAATPPRILSFQGRLTNSSGTPVTSATNIVFRIWDQESGGTEGTCTGGGGEDCFWKSKTWSVTPDSNGIFSVQLGDTGQSDTAIPATLFSDNAALYLGVTIGADSEATPRQRIASSSYALNSDSLDGIDSLSFLRSDTSDNFTSGTLQTDDGTTLTINSTTIGIGNATGDTITVNGTPTFNTDTNFTLAGTENVAMTSDLAGTVDVISIIGTPSASAGTTQGIFIQQANSANANGLDSAIVIDNADTNLAVTDAIKIMDSGGGAYTNYINAPNFTVSNGANVTLGLQGELRLADSDSSNYVAWKGPGAIGSNVVWTLPSSDGSGCFQSNGSGTVSIAACGGGSFSGEIDDTTNNSLTFTSDDASPPAGTVNSIFRDNTGDLNINVITGKTLNLQIAGVDEYNFSATQANLNSNDLLTTGNASLGSAAAINVARVLNIDNTSTSSGRIGLYVQQDYSGSGLNATVTGANITAQYSATAGSGLITSGLNLASKHNSGQPINSLEGIRITLSSTASGAGAISNAFAYRAMSPTWTGDAPDTTIGLQILDQGNAGTTTTYGIYLDAQQNSTNAYGLCFDCDGTWTASTVAAGIQFGTDINAVTLYRSASDTLRTGDNFTVDLDLTVTGNDVNFGNGEILDNNTNSTFTFSTNAAGTPDKIAIAPNTSGGATFTATIGTADLTVGNQTFNFPDLAAATSATICVSGQACSGGTSTTTIGYWTRTGTSLSPNNTNDVIAVSSNAVAAAGILDLTASGTITSGNNAVRLTANSTNTGTILNISGTGLTTGQLISLTLGSDLTSGSALSLTGASYSVAAGGTSNLLTASFTNASTNTSGGSVLNGLNLASSISNSGVTGTKTTNALNISLNSGASCSGGDCTWNGANIVTSTGGGASVLTSNALNVSAAGISFGILNGLRISDISGAGGTETGIYLGSGWDRAICFDCDGTYTPTGVGGGLQWGTDANSVNLYRSANDILKTDDSFVVGANLTVSGTTGLTFDGSGGDITFTNGEKIDNDTNGTIAVTGDLDVSGTGAFGSGGTVSVSKGIDLVNTFTSIANCTVNCYGIFIDNTVNNPSSPIGFVGIFSRLTAANAAYTLSNVYNYYSANPIDGGASVAITNAYGLYLEPITSATTTNVGICFDCDGTFGTNTVGSGIQWGTDNAAQLFRSGANTLSFGTTTTLTAAGALEVSSGGSSALTLNSASGTVALAADDGLSIDLNPASTTAIGISATITTTGALNTQRGFALTFDGTGTSEQGIYINQTAAGAVDDAIKIENNGGIYGDGILLANTSGTFTNGLTFTGTFTTLISAPNFSVTNAGAVTAVGINSGSGLLQGSLGLTIIGAAVSLNNSSNFDTNINTGTSTGTINIGNSSSANIKLGKFTTANGLIYVSATDGTLAETSVNAGATQCLTQTSSAAPTWGSCAGGSVALDTIAAASADDAALLNADNTIEWNWALTSATSKGITLGESAASTGGGGDQHILRIDTASTSTAGPLEIVSNSADGGDIEFNLASAGDFVIQDNGTTYLEFSDASVTTWTLPATGSIIVDAAATDSTIAGPIIDLNLDSQTNGNIGLNIDYNLTAGAGSSTQYAAKINLSHTPSTIDTLYGLGIYWNDTANNSGTGSLLVLDNLDTGASLASGIMISATGTITTAINASAANIGDALSVGSNFVLFNGIRAFSSSSTVLTIEDTSGNDLLTITDNGTNGSLAITNNLSVTGTTITFSGLTNCGALATNSSGVVQCGEATGDTATFTDSNPAAYANNTTTELFNDATRPNITPNTTSQTVLVKVSSRARGASTTDSFASIRIVREDDAGSTTPSCDGTDPQVGDFFNTSMTTNNAATDTAEATGIFLDSPASTSDVYYTVCSQALTGSQTHQSLNVTLIELGADLAENYYTTDDSVSAGHLVTMDPTLPAGAKKTTSASDSQILGVVSTAPGKVLDDYIGRSFGRPIPVALSGRVPVKVSNENGPIKVGDLITSSSTPGVGMKATKAGYVIGRAMTSFSGEPSAGPGQEGLVMVFINTHYADPERLSSVDSFMKNATASAQTNSDPTATASALILLSLDEGNNFVASISAGAKFIWKNSAGQIVAWISDTGEALFSKVTALVGDFGKLVFGEAVVKKDAKIAGEASFESGATEVLIESNKVTEESLINLTASTKTNGLSLYIKEKLPGEGFVVALERNSGDQPNQATASATQVIKFTWFILNQE